MNHEYYDYFCFLDDLRDGGGIDMFSSAIYLEEEFDIPHDQAGQVLWAWIKNKQLPVDPSGFAV